MEVFISKIKVNLSVIQETVLISLWARTCKLHTTDPIIADPKLAEILTNTFRLRGKGERERV